MIEKTFDRVALNRNRWRAAQGKKPAGFLLRRACDDIVGRVAMMTRDFPICADIGCHDATVSRALGGLDKVGAVFSFDRCEAFARSIDTPFCVADDEALPLRPGAFDLIVSALSLHWVNDLPGTLVQIRRALKPDGLFLGVLAGGRTLHELRGAFLAAESELTRGAHARVAPFADLRDLGQLLARAGFALPVSDKDTVRALYRDPLALMHDLRAMGAANCLSQRSRAPLRRDVLFRAIELYVENHGRRDGRIQATYELICLTGWGPAGSQPKPLRPGSAARRLADALGTREHVLEGTENDETDIRQDGGAGSLS